MLLHWPNPHVPLAETLGALAHVRKLGMARHIGVSNFTVALIDEAVAVCPEPLVCDQVEYHPYLDQTKVREACARHGMAVVAYSPVAKGRIKNDETLARIGQAHGKTPAQVCLRWLVQQNVAAIPRTSKIERLSENIDIFDFALSEEEMQQIFAMGSAEGPAHRFRFRAEMGLRLPHGPLCWRQARIPRMETGPDHAPIGEGHVLRGRCSRRRNVDRAR